MPKYKKCPRCELNYITEDQDLCDVCKAEMKIGGFELLEDEDEDRVCPICHINYLEPGEKICAECRETKAEKAKSESFDEVVEVVGTEEEPTEISFSELEEKEGYGDNFKEDAFDDPDVFAVDDFVADDIIADDGVIDDVMIDEVALDDEEDDEVVKPANPEDEFEEIDLDDIDDDEDDEDEEDDDEEEDI